eukprot:TRINITY_DN4273_c0_g1_i1.p1 TRINITY_DN4273_c0_g1~~TRINITY_DN4273_c0_g1_i1.p1  ORF type:complete len:755 (-),score=273.91 TRINITY_DN4273_c0_g1_i1:166-2430(-)
MRNLFKVIVRNSFRNFSSSSYTMTSSITETAQKALETKLAELKINVSTYKHAVCKTNEELLKEATTHNFLDAGILAKNLYLCDGRKKKPYLVVLEHDREMEVKEIAAAAGCKGGLRMEKPEVMKATLQVEPGCVTPVAVMNDKQKATVVLISKGFASKKMLIHPMNNAASMCIACDDVIAFCKHFGVDAKIVDFGEKLTKEQKVKAVAEEKEKEKKKKEEEKKKKKEEEEKKKKDKESSKDSKEEKPKKKATDDEKLIGIDAKKEQDFSEWYSQVVSRTEMIEYYDVSGCYILRPWAYRIWELIQQFFDTEIKKLGVENSYFPLFVSKRALTAEEDHVAGFAPEVAWVTRSGKTELEEPLAVRPTSETIMYPAFSKWIRSHRDLPLKLNQWCNVVRWEFKNPTPFIRSREFLWQEGHTAYANKKDADEEVLQILDLYAQVYEQLLAVPVIKGKKTEKEKFAGGLYTTTVEAFIPTIGRGVQGATSHCLGQNFSKIFNIEFENEKGGKSLAWQNSWGLTTRTIGVMVMTHGDDKGLILPPRVAPIQVVIVPVFYKEPEKILAQADKLFTDLKAAGVRVKLDARDNYTPGWKYHEWEMKGVPLRVDLGPRDLEAQKVILCRRDLGTKTECKWSDIGKTVPKLLTEIQESMLAKAKKDHDSHMVQCRTWDQFMAALTNKNMALVPWCEVKQCEQTIKERTGEASKEMKEKKSDEEEKGLTGAAKSLCVPFQQQACQNERCIQCGEPAKCWCLFGRSY